MKTLLVCERSGGHVFPALAIAEKLRQRGEQVCFFVTSFLLKEYLEKEGFKVYGRSFSFRNIVWEGFFRAIEAVYLLVKLRPRRVIGLGGRDSFFLILFSSLLFLDTTIYELNLTFGKTNRVLSFFVRKVWLGFEDKYFSGKKYNKFKVVGIPLRENIKKIDRNVARQKLGFNERPVIFCFGGSQGASFINRVFMEFLQSSGDDYQVIHLSGEREYFEISQLYNRIEKRKFIVSFYYAMEILYSAADLVICRAGASTLGEISYYKLPAVLIPYPGGGNHQRKNAFYFEEKGAARVFLEENFSFQEFKKAVESMLYDQEVRENFRKNLDKIRLGVSSEEFLENIE